MVELKEEEKLNMVITGVLGGLAEVLAVVLQLVQFLVLGSIIASWLSADPSNPIVNALYRATEPMYRPLRKLTSKIPGPLDWAPFAVILICIFLRSAVVDTLRMYASLGVR
jgi:YggT family protein